MLSHWVRHFPDKSIPDCGHPALPQVLMLPALSRKDLAFSVTLVILTGVGSLAVRPVDVNERERIELLEAVQVAQWVYDYPDGLLVGRATWVRVGTALLEYRQAYRGDELLIWGARQPIALSIRQP